MDKTSCLDAVAIAFIFNGQNSGIPATSRFPTSSLLFVCRSKAERTVFYGAGDAEIVFAKD